MVKMRYVVRYEPQGPALLDTYPQSKARLEKVGWLPLFMKYSNHNLEVTNSFTLNLNGDKVQVGNVKLKLTEALVARACGIS